MDPASFCRVRPGGKTVQSGLSKVLSSRKSTPEHFGPIFDWVSVLENLGCRRSNFIRLTIRKGLGPPRHMWHRVFLIFRDRTPKDESLPHPGLYSYSTPTHRWSGRSQSQGFTETVPLVEGYRLHEKCKFLYIKNKLDQGLYVTPFSVTKVMTFFSTNTS